MGMWADNLLDGAYLLEDVPEKLILEHSTLCGHTGKAQRPLRDF